MPLPRLFAGQLGNRIIIRRAAKIDDGKGAQSKVWSDYCSVWAEVQGLDGRESVMTSALQGISVYRIRIRFRSDLISTDQVRLGNVDLNIRSIADPNGNREQLVIIADTGSIEA